MSLIFQIEIPKRSSTCFKGGERLTGGMEYYSLLMQDEQQKFVRQDFCSVCWNQIHQENAFNSKESYWKSRVEKKQENESHQFQSKQEKALTLLKNILQQPDKSDTEVFVLVLFLARARRLVLRSEIKQDEGSYSLYEVQGQDEFLTIKNINLSEMDHVAIQTSLANQLNAL